MLAGAKNRNSTRRPLPPAQRRKRLWGLALISPWLIGLLAFKLGPILASLALAFTNYPLLDPSQTQFIGLANFVRIFHDPDALTVLGETLSPALVLIPVQIGASILLASLLSHKGLKMRNTVRSLFFLPSIIPTAAAMFMFKGFVNPDSGWLNRLILGPLGLAGLNQLSSASGQPAFFLLASLWAIGPGFLIIMTSLEAIPTEIHEAAHMDGANLFQHFFGITIPLISPAIFFTLILNLTAMFAGSSLVDRGNNFAETYSTSTTSYDSYLHYVLFDLQKLGYASSLGWAFFAFILIVVLALFATAKYWVYFPDAER